MKGGIELTTFSEDSDQSGSFVGLTRRAQRGSYHSYTEIYNGATPGEVDSNSFHPPPLPEYLNTPLNKSVRSLSPPALPPRRTTTTPHLRPRLQPHLRPRLQPRFENHVVNIKTPKTGRRPRPRRQLIDFPTWLVVVIILFLVVGLFLDAALWCILLVLGDFEGQDKMDNANNV